jgi:hypothetical protein
MKEIEQGKHENKIWIKKTLNVRKPNKIAEQQSSMQMKLENIK